MEMEGQQATSDQVVNDDLESVSLVVETNNNISDKLTVLIASSSVEDGSHGSDDSERLDTPTGSVHTSEWDPSSVYQKITESDNPFLDQNDTLDESTRLNISSAKYSGLINPNDEYKDANDDESLLQRNHQQNDIDNGNTNKPRLNGSLINKANPQLNSKIQILEANKLSEGQGRNYVVYTIKYGAASVRRRYSDFESLRSILVKLFPTSLLPPIPEKQTIKNYSKSITGSKSNYLLPSEGIVSVDLALSVINGSVTNSDEKLIRHRIRMLTGFLNKLLQDEEITKTSIMSDFLDPNNISWSDFVNSSATFSSLPKSVLQCNPLDPTATTRIHATLPIPSSSPHILTPKDKNGENKNMDKKDSFEVFEHEYKIYERLLKNGFYKYNKRITQNMHDMQSDVLELSETFAQFANTQGSYTDLVEELTYLSNVYDESGILLENIVSLIYYNINEPLSETIHMVGSARDLIKFRKLKSIQLEMVQSSLKSKNFQMEKLKTQENNTKKVNEEIENELGASNIRKINLQRPETKSYSGKLYNKFNKLATMVKESINYQEQDSQTAIVNLKKDIKLLIESSAVAESDLKEISDIIKRDRLSRFSKEREAALSEILQNYSKCMREYAQKYLDIWKDVKSRQEQ